MEYIEIEDAKLIRSTPKAGLYQIDGEEHWIPWSQINEGSVDRDGETGSIYISEWIAEQKGLA